MRRSRILFFIALALIATAYLGASAYLFVRQRELIFQPGGEILKTPSALDLSYETVWLPLGKSADTSVGAVVDTGAGTKGLNGWWVPNSDASAPVLLYLHGNDRNIGANVDHVARLARMGFSVLIFDYRGYGKSRGGFPSEAKVYEDAETAWTYLIETHSADPARTFIYGHSLGGAIAIHLAANHPEAAGLITESTFTSMREMAEARYGYLPIDWLLNQRFDSLAAIEKLRIPVLLIHGKADDLVPYSMAERLYRSATPPKRLLLVAGAGHDNCAVVAGKRYADEVRAFVASVDKAQR